VIAGVPTDISPATFTAQYDAVLADARMVEAVDPGMTTRLTPSCDLPTRGLAFPPRRLVQTARAVGIAGGSSLVLSICQDDFTDVASAIASHIAESTASTCP
jgi:hypothetical protein